MMRFSSCTHLFYAFALGLSLVALSFTPLMAQSINCTATMSDIQFGTVSLRSGISNQSSGTLNVQCTGIGTIGVCVSIGSGSGGSGGGFEPRFMRRADATALAYQLRPNGSGLGGGVWDDVFISVPTTLGSGSVNVPVFADITSTGVGTATGAYSSTFNTTADIWLEYNTSSCNQPGTVQAIDPFTVSAIVAASCEVDAGFLDFGTINAADTGNIDATTNFTVRCTDSTAYTVRLDDGMGAGATGPADRRMTGPLAQLRYGLYLNASRTQPWGEDAGNSISNVGSGLDQNLSVYGRIFAGQPLLAGAYSDTVLITVEY